MEGKPQAASLAHGLREGLRPETTNIKPGQPHSPRGKSSLEGSCCLRLPFAVFPLTLQGRLS